MAINGDLGTVLIAGKPYHYVTDPETKKARAVPGVDPNEPGTCDALLTLLGHLKGKCVKDLGHSEPDSREVNGVTEYSKTPLHETAGGMKWPSSTPVATITPAGLR